MPDFFGAIAKRKGYISEEELQRALQIQKEMDMRGESHKLLGIIMLEFQILSSTQLLDILKEMEQKKHHSPIL